MPLRSSLLIHSALSLLQIYLQLVTLLFEKQQLIFVVPHVAVLLADSVLRPNDVNPRRWRLYIAPKVRQCDSPEDGVFYCDRLTTMVYVMGQ